MSNPAAVMPELGRIEVQEVPLREPGPREVRVRAVGVCGSDTAYYRIGRIGDWIVDGPIILGHEAAGEVVAVGEAVTRVQVGDRVAIDSRMKSRLAVQALENAVAMRGDVAGCVIHSDRGSQFRSRKFLRALTRHRMVGSMGRVGSSLLTGYSTGEPWRRHAEERRVRRGADARVQHVSHDGQGSPAARAA